MKPDFDDNDDWKPVGEVPWWMSAVGAGILFIILGGMVALCITG
jgi:hypothetical protein